MSNSPKYRAHSGFILALFLLFLLCSRSDYAYLFAQDLSFFKARNPAGEFEKSYKLDYNQQNKIAPSFVLGDDYENPDKVSSPAYAASHDKANSHILASINASLAEQTFAIKSQVEEFSELTFYINIDESELFGSLTIILFQDPENYYFAHLNQPFEAKQWNFVSIGRGDFEVFGNPVLSQVRQVKLDLQSNPEEDLTVYIDELRYVPENDYIYDWYALNYSLLQLVKLTDDERALSVQNYRERTFYPKKVRPFLNGSIAVKMYFLERGRRCGIVIRGNGEHGYWFLMDGSPTLSWELLGGNDQKEFLSGGDLDNQGNFAGLSYWLEAVADENNVSVFAGPERDELQFVTAIHDTDPKIGRAGIVVLDRTRCLYNDINVSYNLDE